jgi:hypothetical protein
MYIDVHSGRVKVGGSFTFDELHYTSSHRHPGPQFLFDLVLHTSLPAMIPTMVSTPAADSSEHCSHSLLKNSAPWPSLSLAAPSRFTSPLACQLLLPFGELCQYDFALLPSPATTPMDSHLPTGSITPSVDFVPPLAAAAAYLTAPEVMSIELSGNPFGSSFVETIPITGTHETAGLQLQFDSLCGRLCLLACLPGTPAARISIRWRSRLRFAYILYINDVSIDKNLSDFKQVIQTLRHHKATTCTICFTFDEIRNSLSLLLDFLNSTLINFVTCARSLKVFVNPLLLLLVPLPVVLPI